MPMESARRSGPSVVTATAHTVRSLSVEVASVNGRVPVGVAGLPGEDRRSKRFTGTGGAHCPPDGAGVPRPGRSEQAKDDPGSAAWVTGVIWDERRRMAVGRAGYHAPPDPSGMVEIGYAVDPAFRRRGYARAALETLLERAATEPLVRRVRVTISPDNVASFRLASQYGFVKVGEQWDAEDGLEIVYEVDAGQL
jgi:GNAT superfamily N-acetyltransferase